MTSKDALTEFKVNPDALPPGIEIIGEGAVGGKSKGLIFASHLIYEAKEELCDYPNLLKIPHSTILATSIFDEFILINELRNVVDQILHEEITDEAMNVKFLTGRFPKQVHNALMKMLERKTLPLVVRSSSILEDRPEHSFAGIYQSVFISNKGPLSKRIAELEMAIRIVYASTYGPNARKYAERMEQLWQTEKMAIIIQEVIGSLHDDGLYYPLFAGVAFSKNYYPWSKRIGVDDGLCRIVAGLGTRAVGRFHATVFSPSHPELRPQGMTVDEILSASQEMIDALDYEDEILKSVHIRDIQPWNEDLFILTETLKNGNYFTETKKFFEPSDKLVLTFKPILMSGRHIPFVPLLKSLLQNLERIIGRPIDIEFAFDPHYGRKEDDGGFYLVQVRPLGRHPEHRPVRIPKDIPKENLLLKSNTVLGNGKIIGITDILWVQHMKYDFTKGYEIAREVGKVNEMFEGMEYVLIGPGRWATTNPELGIPVNYSEISNAAVVVEVSHARLSPDLSYGTHFFADMEASNMLYMGLFLEKGDYLDVDFLLEKRNEVDSEWVKVIRVPHGLNVYVDGDTRVGLIHY